MQSQIKELALRAKAARDRCHELIDEYRRLCGNGEILREVHANLVAEAYQSLSARRPIPEHATDNDHDTWTMPQLAN